MYNKFLSLLIIICRPIVKNSVHSINQLGFFIRKGIAINFITEDEMEKPIHCSHIQPVIDHINHTKHSPQNFALISRDLAIHYSEISDYSEPPDMDAQLTCKSNQKEVVYNFDEMGLKAELLRGIYVYGFEKPSAIQQRTILPCINGHDVIVQAQSGTGKTTSVLISILQNTVTSLNECQALILVPSRKLAQQIEKVIMAFGDFMKIDCHAWIGGKNICNNIRKLDSFPHVVVGTPGCVSALIAKKTLKTQFIKTIVLDEADRLLTSDKVEIKNLFKFFKEDIQVILLSKLMSQDVLDKSTHIVNSPLHILEQNEELELDAIKQFYIKLTNKNEAIIRKHSEINDYSGSLSINIGGRIKSDWKEVVENFHDMNLKEELLSGIYGYGFEKPSAIQKHAILPCINGHDVIVQAQYGTGKTTSVLISILQQIDPSLNKCQALILVPTRDLALQIQKMLIALGEFLKANCHACIGGTDIHDDSRELQMGPHVVVGTLGRVYDMIARNSLQTKFIKTFVLDKADKLLLDLGFKDKIRVIFKYFKEDVQIILLSVPMPKDTLDMNTHFLRNPVCIFMKKEELILEGIKHFFIYFTDIKWVFDTLCSLCNTLNITQVVIFCNTYHKVESLTNNMRLKAFNVSIMHERMDQIQRQSTLYNFCSGTSPVLITTHLLAQTIDVQVSSVINYDLPPNHEHFIRWIDRSFCFDRKGVVVNFITKDNRLAMSAIRPFFNTHVIKIKNPIHTSLIQPIADYMNQTSSQPAPIPKEPPIHNSDGAQLATNHCNISCDNQPDRLDEYCRNDDSSSGDSNRYVHTSNNSYKIE